MPAGYHNCENAFFANIRSLLYSLRSSTYYEIAPKIEYWIEYVIIEQFATAKDLAEEISVVAWHCHDPSSEVPRFLKEFRHTPHRLEQTRAFVDEFCLRVLRWFCGAAASADNFKMDDDAHSGLVPSGGGNGFIRAATFVGGLAKHGLLSREHLQWHVIKPLTFYNNERTRLDPAIRANAIYKVFVAAGDTLLRGLLEPRDVRVCFEIVDAQVSSSSSGIVGFNQARFNELREIHDAWLQRKEEVEAAAIEVPAGDVDTPVASVPQGLPATHAVGADDPSPISQSVEPLSVLRDLGFSINPFVDTPVSTPPSPTLSVSTISDLTPTELGEDFVGASHEQISIRHETFYLRDGDVEIMCGDVVFRIHSPVLSFSSSKLRDMLSKSTLLNAPTPKGCPRIIFKDSAEDFAVLLKMIYTPGFPTWRKVPEFTIFASLLRMATKYGYSDVREQLIHSLEVAYPTKWGAFQAAEILGEEVFGFPKPHPNEVLNLFLEQNVKFAIPLAAYRAAIGGFSSLISEKPGTIVPRLTLASTVHGMEAMRSGASKLAYSIARSIDLRDCRNKSCELSGDTDSVERGLEGLNRIYNSIVREGKSDVLSPLSLNGVFCVNCAKVVEGEYDRWRATIWECLPCIFRVGKNWQGMLGT